MRVIVKGLGRNSIFSLQANRLVAAFRFTYNIISTSPSCLYPTTSPPSCLHTLLIMYNFCFLLQRCTINIIADTKGFVDYKGRGYWMVSQPPSTPIVASANIRLLEPTTNPFQSRLWEGKVIRFHQMKGEWVQYTFRLHSSWSHKTLYVKREFAMVPKQVHTQPQENRGVGPVQSMRPPISI